MPKVHQKTAAKDYPEHGIQKGDTYYSWAFYRQKPRKSKSYPTRGELTQNETKIIVYAVYDQKQQDVTEEFLTKASGELDNASSEELYKYDNLPTGFQMGEKGQELEQNAEAIDQAISDVESIKDNLEDFVDNDAAWEAFLETEPELI